MFKNFEEAEANYYGLWYSETPDFEETLRIASWCYETFPEHENQLLLDLGLLHGLLNHQKESLDFFHKAFDKGIWYPKVFMEALWAFEWFESVVERWMEFSQRDQFESDMAYEFLSSEDISKDKPVFLALHGWGEDIALFRQFWTSDKLKNEYNTVYVQSSQMVGAYHYQWTDYALAKKDIQRVLKILKDEYGLNTEHIIVGGFSEGATTSLKLALEKADMNIKGFVALNPNKPEEMTVESVKAMAENGICGGIITGDQDECFDEQKEMKTLFETTGLSLEWVVTKDFGHWFPKDLNEKIDCVLKCIE